jgi:hypothetical protein
MITSGLFTSNTPEWETPQDFFDALDEEFRFDLERARILRLFQVWW